MTPPMTDPIDWEDIARRFHECYERLAPSFGVPEANRRLMIAVVHEVLGTRMTDLTDGDKLRFIAEWFDTTEVVSQEVSAADLRRMAERLDGLDQIEAARQQGGRDD